MIRAATVSDAAALASIHVEAWRVAYRGIISPTYLDALDISARQSWWQRQLAGGIDVLVSTSGVQPVGFCTTGRSTEEGWGEVFALYVLPQHWGGGHGGNLMRSAEIVLSNQGYDRAMLWVLEANTAARAFYERVGWSLAKPIRIEEIGGRQVTEVRYQRSLPGSAPPGADPRDR